MTEYLTRVQVARYLEISAGTLNRIIKAGLIGYIRVTPGKRGRMRFTQHDLDAYLERNRRNATQ